MTRISSNFRLVTLTALATALPTAAAWAQIIPNPLVRPQRTQQAPAGQQQPAAESQARGATAAPSSRTAGRAIDGEGLPAEAAKQKSPSEQLANLYVSAVIGDRAVLRSLEVRTVPPLNANAASGGTVSSGTRSGESAGGGSGAGAGGASANIAGLRSAMYVVRNGEVLPFLDKLRLLVRVRDTTVTLYDVTDVPPGNYDPLDLMDRGFPVAFRGSVDSVQSAPYVPPTLVAPGKGVDGEAFDAARDTRFRTNTGSPGTTSSGSGSSNNNSSSSGNNNP